MGTHVTYVNVTEDSGADEPLPLFGPPTVTGNSIDFNPIGFDSSSSNGGSDITDSNLAFMVVAKTGNRIQSISFNEFGDTTLAGNVAPGSMGTAAAVFAGGVIDIQEVDFMGINHISVPFSMTFTPSGGTYFLGTDGGGGPLFHTPWSGSVNIDIDAILIANGLNIDPMVGNGATKISIDMDNTLTAVSELGSSALIAKKDVGGFAITLTTTRVPGEIPEPASLALAAIVVVGGYWLVRRRAR